MGAGHRLDSNGVRLYLHQAGHSRSGCTNLKEQIRAAPSGRQSHEFRESSAVSKTNGRVVTANLSRLRRIPLWIFNKEVCSQQFVKMAAERRQFLIGSRCVGITFRKAQLET